MHCAFRALRCCFAGPAEPMSVKPAALWESVVVRGMVSRRVFVWGVAGAPRGQFAAALAHAGLARLRAELCSSPDMAPMASLNPNRETLL